MAMVAQIDSLYFKTRPYKAVPRLLSHLFFQGRFLTTTHRWLNHLILAELKLLKNVPQLRSVTKPIFVVGTGRSGTTIFGKVLSMHKDIGFLNEPKAIWYTIDPRDDVNGHFTRGEARYRFAAGDAVPEKRRAAQRLFGNYLALTGTQRVLDKNPEIIFRIPYVKAIFPDARFIFLLRNGWDTIGSIVKWSSDAARRVNGELEDWWGVNRRKWQLIVAQLVPDEPLLAHAQESIVSFTRQEDKAAIEWIVTMQEGLRLRQSAAAPICMVQYEELTARPAATLARILEFCQLPHDERFLAYAEKVLAPVPAKPPVFLPETIRGAFAQTMRQLDYPYAIAPVHHVGPDNEGGT